MESDYHNPYDHHLGDQTGMNGTRLPESLGGSGGDHLQNHYEAPSCLVRNPSGSLFIPSSGKCFTLSKSKLQHQKIRFGFYNKEFQSNNENIIFKF